MAISVRDNLSPIVYDEQAKMVRNEVGQPAFTLTIDGKTVEAYENQTVLSAANDNGITDIPNMCDDEKLEPTATCRMCLVEIEGLDRPLAACTTPAFPGLVVAMAHPIAHQRLPILRVARPVRARTLDRRYSSRVPGGRQAPARNDDPP